VEQRKRRELANVFGDGPAAIEGVMNVTGRSERWVKTWLADGLKRGDLERFKDDEPTGGRPAWVYALTYAPTRPGTWPKDKPRPRTYSPTDPPLENLLRMLRIKDGQTAIIEVTSEPKTVLYHKHIERTKHGPDYRASICAGPGCLYCPDGPPTRWHVCDIIVESIDGKPPVNPDRRKGTISALHIAPPIPVPDRLRFIEGITTVIPSGRGEWKRTGKGRDTRYTFSAKLMVGRPAEPFVQTYGGRESGTAPARIPAPVRAA
jgi:hypothetical protein